jgi:2,4-dienoyl-CoA reductase-like NADH-dependent reductase (Old Yellow Enzyme family)
VGNRSFFDKTIAPSPVKLDFGPGLLAKAASALLFGSPREMTVEDICGENGVIEQFVEAAKQSFDAGFKGVELHGA